MSTITNTNIRVGPGVYMALKEMADKSGLTIGTCANLMAAFALISLDKNLSTFSPDTQKAVVADSLVVMSEIFKLASLEAIKNTSFAEVYKTLLGQTTEEKPGQATHE